MFVLIVRFRAAKGKEKELELMFRNASVNVHKNERDTLTYHLHRKIGDSAEMLLYERYTDREAWEVTHKSKPYIKELLAKLPKYIEGNVKREEYELVELD